MMHPLVWILLLSVEKIILPYHPLPASIIFHCDGVDTAEGLSGALIKRADYVSTFLPDALFIEAIL